MDQLLRGLLRSRLDSYVNEDGLDSEITSAHPVLSVVIPVYNGAAQIVGLLNALLSQCDSRCEIIAVDDCSTDDTASQLGAYAARGVKCLRTERNSGAGAARNLGAATALGDHLLFFDCDDVPSPVLLPTVLATIDAYPQSAFGGFLLAKQASRALDVSILKTTTDINPPVPKVFPPHAYAARLLFGRYLVSCSSAYVRKSLFDAHGGFADAVRLYEDPELFARISATTPFMQIPEVLAIYRIADAPSDERLRIGAADALIASLSELADRHGALYRLVALIFAFRMVILARSSGTPLRACFASLKESGLGICSRAAGHVLLCCVTPSTLRVGLKLYRQLCRTSLSKGFRTATHFAPASSFVKDAAASRRVLGHYRNEQAE